MTVVEIATHTFRARTGKSGLLTRVPCSLTLTCMLTLDRDRQIVLSVGRFGQLATAHIHSMYFHGHKSPSPMYRTLERLVARKYLAPVTRRPIGGNGTGSGQNVYQLGSAGWTLVGNAGRYWPYREVSLHTLLIADTLVELLELQHQGRIEILEYEVDSREHVTWRKVEGIELRPDLYVELRTTWEKDSRRYWFEIDRGTERRDKIIEKVVDYYNADGLLPDGESLPTVVFIAPDTDRVNILNNWIRKGPEDGQGLFVVSTIPALAGMLFG